MAEATRWLGEEEAAAWQALIRLVTLLPQALDKQLREDVGISHTYYSMLAMLSAEPDRTLPMGELARITGTSPSRLSHAVTALETRGWVTRTPCPTDRRVQWATLTDAGYDVLAQVAPTHVAEVRRLVFDALSTVQVRQLHSVAGAIVAALDADAG